jgi:hypothetical protein
MSEVKHTPGRSEHHIDRMTWQEAYPASSGIKCTLCGKCRLGWMGAEPAELTPGCVTVRIRISQTIDNEYANRLPDWLPDSIAQGDNDVSLDVARSILSDAEYNSDREAVDVGPYGTPLPVFNAYRALAKQVRAAIAKAEGGSHV